MKNKNLAKRVYRGGMRRVRRILTGSPVPGSPFDALHQKLFRDTTPDNDFVIFDVGAHVGESFWRFHRMFPDSTIHSFEADKGNFENLSRNLREFPKARLNNFGVGSKHEFKKFYKNLKTNTSSFVPVDPESEWATEKSRRQGVSYNEFTSEVYDMEIRSLDSYMEENSIDHINILKIDTQGYEAEVLKGARRTLEQNKVDVIETELIVGAAYKNVLGFSDLENILKPCGYSFFAIDHAGNLQDTPSLSFDLIYVSDRFLAGRRIPKAA